MGKDFENNRFSAPTPKLVAQVIVQQSAIAKEAFDLGLKAGAQSSAISILSDDKVALLAKAFRQAIATNLKKHLATK